MIDLLIKNAYIQEFKSTMDIAIKEGKIIDVREKIIAEDVCEMIDANGRLVTTGFVDSHTHLEKAFTMGQTECFTLEEAIQTFEKRCENISEEDIKDRASKVLNMAIKNGTTAIRTHILVDQNIELMGIKVLSELKEEYADLIDIQIVAMAPVEGEIIDERNIQLLDEAAKYSIDLYGGSPSLSSNPQEQIDVIFKLAKKYNLGVDFHSDESDEPIISTLDYLAEKTIQENMQGKVTASHCVALGYVDDQMAKEIIEKIKEAQINVITLPSCNVYLMGRNDKHPISRGITCVGSLLHADVIVALGSDNIRDPFRPFGNADMLEEALFASQVFQMGTTSQLNTIFKMTTYNGAKTLRLDNYGLEIDCFADLIVFDAKTTDEAVITQANKAYVIKRGKIIVENKRETIVKDDLLMN